jgi:hypothetical protein
LCCGRWQSAEVVEPEVRLAGIRHTAVAHFEVAARMLDLDGSTSAWC